MYDTTWWLWLVTVWEVAVYNSVLDLQQCWQVHFPQRLLEICQEVIWSFTLVLQHCKTQLAISTALLTAHSLRFAMH